MEPKHLMLLEHFMKYTRLEIIEKDWSSEDCHIDYICFDGKHEKPYIVFIDVFVTHGSMEVEHKTREEFEKVITEWAKTTDFSGVALRYDTLILNILPNRNALIRHHLKVH